MARPKCCRLVGASPATLLFKPQGIPSTELTEIVLTLDEAEALRLADLEGAYQEEASLRMGVSRATFGRIVTEARRKVAQAIFQGQMLRIHGGKVQPAPATLVPPATSNSKDTSVMRIAIPLADGTLSRHFGHCSQFYVAEVDRKQGKVISQEYLVPPPHAPGVIPRFLVQQGIQVILAGNMGDRAEKILTHAGMEVHMGVLEEDPARLIEEYLKGELRTGAVECHHDHHHHH
jgi:predicted DNA-binding protein (UPF0251 family)/predicted Fe-Mo cluster-binding NifX family protein